MRFEYPIDATHVPVFTTESILRRSQVKNRKILLEKVQLLLHILNRSGDCSWLCQYGYNIVAALFQFHMFTASKASWLQSAENNLIDVLASRVFCAFSNVLDVTEHHSTCTGRGEVESIHQMG